MASTWVIIFVVLLVIEIVTYNLVSIWFAFGALAAFISTYFTNDTSIHITVFLTASFIFLICLRRFVMIYLKPKKISTNLDRTIGMTGIITRDIDSLEPGEVKVDGKLWTAQASENIKKGTKVEILGIEGVKLIVKKEGGNK